MKWVQLDDIVGSVPGATMKGTATAGTAVAGVATADTAKVMPRDI